MPTTPPAGLGGKIDLHAAGAAATAIEIERACENARRLKLRAVCVNGSRVELASARLEDSGVKVVALCGFPIGASDGDVKRFEAESAIDNGADEIEVMLNAGLLKDGAHQKVLRELLDIVEAADERPVCGVLELGVLTREEIVAGCQTLAEAGAQCVATGSGWLPGAPVNPEQIKLLREALDPGKGIKAVGVNDGAAASALLNAGATRFGLIHGAHAPGWMGELCRD